MKMWTKKGDGSVHWDEEAKILLIELLKKNIDAITSDHQSSQKANAWKNVYDELIDAGMPMTSIDRVKRCWSRLKMTQQNKSRGSSMPNSKKLNHAIISLMNRASCRDMMPKPKIKQEPVDNWDSEVKAPTPETLHMNPVVLLNRIQAEDIQAEEAGDLKMTSTLRPSTDYWNLMKRVAENDLKLKVLQYQHEQERIQMERELHQKNIILLDRKINALHGSSFYD